MRDTLSILYHFEAHFGPKREQVLELYGSDGQFGSSFGVLKSVQFEVSTGQMGLECFLVNLRSQSDLLLLGHFVFTLCFISIK